MFHRQTAIMHRGSPGPLHGFTNPVEIVISPSKINYLVMSKRHWEALALPLDAPHVSIVAAQCEYGSRRERRSRHHTDLLFSFHSASPQ
jgi:hypothetical protein